MKQSFLAAIIMLLIIVVPLHAQAASRDLNLEEQVKDSHDATSTISGVDVSEEVQSSYEGYEDGEIVYNWRVELGDYDVASIEKATDISKFAVAGVKNKTYTGKSIIQKFTIKNGNTILKQDVDYVATYKNNKKIGKATIKISGKGKYTGSITKTFKINPKKAAISSIKTKANTTAELTWKKVSNASGYIIYLADGSGKYKKIKTIKKNSTLSYTITDLKQGNTYKIKVRAYKKVNKKNYYGSYSSKKTINIKKKSGTKEEQTTELQLKVEITGKHSARIIATDPNLKDSYKTDILDNINYIREWYVRFWVRDKWNSPHTYRVYTRINDSSKDGVTQRNIADCEGRFMLVSDIMEDICPTTFQVEGNSLIWEFTIPEEYLKEQHLLYDDFDLRKAENFSVGITDGVDETKSVFKTFNTEDVKIIK